MWETRNDPKRFAACSPTVGLNSDVDAQCAPPHFPFVDEPAENNIVQFLLSFVPSIEIFFAYLPVEEFYHFSPRPLV